jgi:hypothetical protein
MRVRRKIEYPFVVLGFIPKLVVHRKEISHTLFLPLPLVQSLCKRHSKALADKYGTDPGISHGDIITGILLKVRGTFSQGQRRDISKIAHDFSSLECMINRVGRWRYRKL